VLLEAARDLDLPLMLLENTRRWQQLLAAFCAAEPAVDGCHVDKNDSVQLIRLLQKHWPLPLTAGMQQQDLTPQQ
jgi:hypothetical protein